ncbi:MAG: TlpA family protein disulfide reductase [Butyricicoccus sp.]|nr:TlpA family protein disulfide reductase [Butyricicoccus sp.]
MRNKGFLGVAAFLILILVLGVVVYPKLVDNYSGDLQNQLEVVDTPAASVEIESPEEAEPILAPDFTVYDAEGNEVHLSDFAGKPVVLNFWASWCGPCKSELPGFEAVYQELGDEAAFMMINLTDGVSETVDGVSEFVANGGYTFPVYFDSAQNAAYTYGVSSIPATALINADGEIVAAQVGVVSESSLRNAVLSMLSTGGA